MNGDTLLPVWRTLCQDRGQISDAKNGGGSEFEEFCFQEANGMVQSSLLSR